MMLLKYCTQYARKYGKLSSSYRTGKGQFSFQTLKDDPAKCCTQYASKFGKLSSGHRIGKGQISFQFQRKVMPKNVKTTAQLHSSHTLVKSCSKFSKPGFNNT